MTKLKTLKDLRVPYPYYNGDEKILRDLIKKEAIKWGKEGLSLSYKDIGYAQARIEIRWIKHFFNITEEELK